MTEHAGFFKTGDYIEVSGKPEGIVVYADEKQFAIRPFFSVGSKDSIHLKSFIKLYSNDAEHYKDNYWFKVTHNAELPFEYKTDEVEPMILS